MYAAGDGQGTDARGRRAHSHSASPRSSGRRPHPGARARSPHPAGRGASLLLLPAKLSSPGWASGPRAGAPPPRAEQGQAGAKGVPGPGRRARVGSPRPWAALARLATKPRQDGPSPPPGTVNQRPPLPGRPGPAPPRAAGHTSPRPPAPGASRGANFAGRGARVGAGGRPCPAAPHPHRPPARPPGRSPSTAASSGSSSSAAPSLRRAMAALPGASGRGSAGARAARARARAPGSGGRGERRGAAHTQPPPPRSQQNEPSSPGRTGTRAPPALGTAHLGRGRGGSPAGPPPPARALHPSWPRAPPGSRVPAPAGSPAGSAGSGARKPLALGRRRHWAPPRAAVVSPDAVAPPDKAAISAQMFLNFY